jgi:hypothetical protein
VALAILGVTLNSALERDIGSGALITALLLAALWVSTTAWYLYCCISGIYSLRRKFPVQSMRFLQDAYRLGLLRTSGSAYQFRHADLQDRLAPPRAPSLSDNLLQN